MSGRVYIGTSGWAYKSWGEIFYPPGTRPAQQLSYYATRFPTVEINASFYRLPTAEAVAGWHDQAPPGFVYAVKGSRTVTHFFKLKPGARSFPLLLARLPLLRDHLGPVLWQLPPGFARDDDRLLAFLELLPDRFRHAIEFRDRSWLVDPVFRLLELNRIAHVSLSAAWFPRDLTLTTDLTYVRLHGLAGGTAHDYTRRELAPWARHLADGAARGLDAFVYFNNDVNVRAPHNAEMLMEMVGEPAVLPSRPDAAAHVASPAQADRRRRRGAGGRPGGGRRRGHAPAVPRTR